MNDQENYSGHSWSGEPRTIVLDHTRDKLLTAFGKATLKDRYLMPGETPQRLFARVATAYSESNDHAQRLYDAISQLWFMPSTPILSNGGTDRGNPISCFLNDVEDSLDGISEIWNENVWLAARGGGIGTNWSKVRSIGEPISDLGETSGIIPFVKVQDSLTLGISQGSLRRGSSAAYLDVRHPEIEEFVEIRRATGGDPNRKCLNVHHGVVIPDAFMEAVKAGEKWDLRSPKTGEIIKTIEARHLWQKILQTRMETGEPYLLFIDTVQRAQPAHQKKLGLYCTTSNLCSEITLATGKDYLGERRTAVCCLSSLNIETWDAWKGNRQFIKDCLLFLDEVLESFISRTKVMQGFDAARYSAIRERSIGLGVMGLQSYMQQHGSGMEGLHFKSVNKAFFKSLRKMADSINHEVALERGSAPDVDAAGGEPRRWTNMFAVAPTASISIICGGTSPGIEPFPTNIFTQKTLSGSYTVKNRYLEKLLYAKAEKNTYVAAPDITILDVIEQWVADQWTSILNHEGSVQHLPYLTNDEKAAFKTAFEIKQRWLLEGMADRAPFVDQAVSNNYFLLPTVSVKTLHNLHFKAWEKGVKSLYYLRSLSKQRAAKVSHLAGEMPVAEQYAVDQDDESEFEECLVCQ